MIHHLIREKAIESNYIISFTVARHIEDDLHSNSGDMSTIIREYNITRRLYPVSRYHGHTSGRISIVYSSCIFIPKGQMASYHDASLAYETSFAMHEGGFEK